MNKSVNTSVLGSAMLLLALAGCGGGGGGGPAPAPAPAPQATLPEGIWETSDQQTVAYVLPARDGSAGEVWAIASASPTPMLQGALAVDGTRFVAGSARYLTSNAADAADARVVLESVGTGQLSLSSQVGSGATPAVISMTPSATYQRTATLAEWSGCWQIAGDAIASSFCVSDAGVISGSRGGCQLLGTVGLRPEAKAVVSVTLIEQGCSEGQTFTGIGAYARNQGVVVESSRMLALKNAAGNRRSIVGLTKVN